MRRTIEVITSVECIALLGIRCSDAHSDFLRLLVGDTHEFQEFSVMSPVLLPELGTSSCFQVDLCRNPAVLVLLQSRDPLLDVCDAPSCRL